MGGIGGMLSLGSVLALAGELVNRLRFHETVEEEDALEHADEFSEESGTPSVSAASSSTPGQATRFSGRGARRAAAAPAKLDARGRAMQETALTIKPLSNFIYRAMQVGVLLIAAGTILGGVWADASWGRFWGWDPKEVWALITLLVYLVPLHGRFAGWVNTFGLAVASVVCFLSVVMAWYGVNFVLGVGLHSYGFTEGGSQGLMSMIIAGVLSIPFGGLLAAASGLPPSLSPAPLIWRSFVARGRLFNHGCPPPAHGGFLVVAVMPGDCFQNAVARLPGNRQRNLISLRAELGDGECLLRAGQRRAGPGLQRKRQPPTNRPGFIVDHHDGELARGAGLERRAGRSSGTRPSGLNASPR